MRETKALLARNAATPPATMRPRHVIHRVAAVRGHGVARAIFSFAAEHADYLRCDTHEDNAPMRRALMSFGFRECGTITVANGTQRVTYDWLKEPLDGGTPASPTTR